MALTISATDSEIPKPVNVAFEQTLLRNARPIAVYYIGTQPGELAENRGTATVGWRRFITSADDSTGSAIAPTTSALTELTGAAAYGMGRTPDVVQRTDVTTAVSKYGQFFYVNEEVDVLNFNHTMDGIVQTLAISAGRSLNYLARNEIEDNSTLRYAGNVASDGLVKAVAVVGDLDRALNELASNYATTFNAMATGSGNTGTTPLLPSMWGFVHTHVGYDISKLSGFKSVETYAGQVRTMPGEIGFYGLAGVGCRFISTPEASIDTGSGEAISGADVRATSGNADLYTIVLKGRDADGSVGLGRQLPDGSFVTSENLPSPLQLIVKGRNTNKPSGLDDPFDEVMSVAWKGWAANKLLNAKWSRGIRVAATNLSN